MLTDYSGYLEFLARYREDEQDGELDNNDQRFEETLFQESFRLDTRGFVYHPNFMEFELGGLFGLLQQDFEQKFGGRKFSSSDDGPILEFDFTGDFLQEKKYPFNVFARRRQALQPRPFQTSLEVTTTNLGFVWQYVDIKAPTSMQFYHTKVDLDPLSSPTPASGRAFRQRAGSYESTNLRFETEYHFTDYNFASLIYTHEDTEEDPFELEFKKDELTLAHRVDFGQWRQHRLESQLTFFDQSGTFDIDRTRLREILRLEHSETLRSWYRLEFLDRNQGQLQGVPPIKEDTFFITATLEHELYESLFSEFYGFYQSQEFDSGLDIDNYGTQAIFDYRKLNPWGVLLGNARFGLRREDRDGGSFSVAIEDERHTFRDPAPVVLANTNVRTATIVVRSDDRLTVYQEFRDYVVMVRGDRTELERVPTGLILDGETVLVDYVFDVLGDYELDTGDINLRIRQDFDFGLSPYYIFRYQDQSLSPPDARGVQPNDITGHTVGVEFDKGGLRLLAEYEDHDSTISPFNAWRLGADYKHRFGPRATVVLRARWTDLSQFAPAQRDTELLTLEARYRHALTDRLTIEGAVMYRERDDSLARDFDGIDIDLSLEYIVRQTEVRVIFESSEFDYEFTDTDALSLWVQVRRYF